MNFNKHLNLDGQHAFLGASKYHWVNYDEAKVADAYAKFLAAKKEPSFTSSPRNVSGLGKNFQSHIKP